jgi:hypothetical protein
MAADGLTRRGDAPHDAAPSPHHHGLLEEGAGPNVVVAVTGADKAVDRVAAADGGAADLPKTPRNALGLVREAWHTYAAASGLDDVFSGATRPKPTDKYKGAKHWVAHRSSRRFLRAALPWIGPPAHLLQHLWLPLLMVMVSTSIAIASDLGGGFDIDPNSVLLTTFRLAGWAMSLVLALRLRIAFDRWWTARVSFGSIGGRLTTIMRYAHLWFPDDHSKVWFGLVWCCSGDDVGSARAPRVREWEIPPDLANLLPHP